ncbi:hypothetical protein [Streptomyces sp. ISL-86]|uniref:hypothetical protein n=1 Tax=Streptomyces sp. ISL-86 TaxID=2819187 RepID=UPI001BEC9D04|nr:hypothetical protein [Streptomyces sp. ISL-86]MBT2456696.1 hypothetical protein [Streptomyces sp. ISL-86]
MTTGGAVSFGGFHEFVADDDPRAAAAEAAARMLRGRGHLTLEYVFGGALVGPTKVGLAEADRVTRVRGRVDEQFTYVLDELVRQAADDPDAVVRLRPFQACTRFLGLPLRESIVWRAARYLHGHGLAHVLMSDGETRALMLTSRGEDCAMSMSTLTVRQYMNDQQQPATAPAFTQNIYGGVAAQGMTNTQNIRHPSGETALPIDRIRALAAQLGLDAASFDEDVELLQDTAQEPARRAGAWRRIKAGLLQAAPALAGQAALTGIEHGLDCLVQ